MTIKTIYFIRHGESVSNAGGMTMEHHAIPLSEKGKFQAQLVADTLVTKPSKVMVSELIRTQQTAQPYCDRHQLNFQTNPLLNEIHAVSFELIEGMMGQQRRQIAQQYWSEGDIHKRMGKRADTFAEFRDRVDGFINEMPNLENNTVIFGHGIWFGMLYWRLLGFAAHDQQGMLAFRRFQSGLPLLNCLAYVLQSQAGGHWSFQVHQGLLERLIRLDI
jgi:alpha-ribazole phosphatase